MFLHVYVFNFAGRGINRSETLSRPPRHSNTPPHKNHRWVSMSLAWRYLTARRPQETTYGSSLRDLQLTRKKQYLRATLLAHVGSWGTGMARKQWRPMKHRSWAFQRYSTCNHSFKITAFSQLHSPAQIQSKRPRGGLCQPSTSI